MISGNFGQNIAYHEPTNNCVDNTYFPRENLRESQKTAKAQDKFDSMTAEERQRYYVHPTLWGRFKRFWNL